MDAAGISETSMKFCQTTRRNYPEGSHWDRWYQRPMLRSKDTRSRYWLRSPRKCSWRGVLLFQVNNMHAGSKWSGEVHVPTVDVIRWRLQKLWSDDLHERSHLLNLGVNGIMILKYHKEVDLVFPNWGFIWFKIGSSGGFYEHRNDSCTFYKKNGLTNWVNKEVRITIDRNLQCGILTIS